jgi:hypothetical protein
VGDDVCETINMVKKAVDKSKKTHPADG